MCSTGIKLLYRTEVCYYPFYRINRDPYRAVLADILGSQFKARTWYEIYISSRGGVTPRKYSFQHNATYSTSICICWTQNLNLHKSLNLNKKKIFNSSTNQRKNIYLIHLLIKVPALKMNSIKITKWVCSSFRLEMFSVKSCLYTPVWKNRTVSFLYP